MFLNLCSRSILVLLTLLSLFCINLLANEKEVASISFGPVNIGEKRINLTVNDFFVDTQVPGKHVTALLQKDSIHWVRQNEILLTPRARILIRVKGHSENLYIKYVKQNILMQAHSNGFSETEFFISLFQPYDIQIFELNKKIGTIRILSKIRSETNHKKTHLIDYSCSPYNLTVKGMDGEYISLGCHLNIIGAFGSKRPMLEVNWITANYTLPDKSNPPYIAIFRDNNPVKITVINKKGQKKTFEIRVKIPSKIPRFKTALGFGPYKFSTTEYDNEEDSYAPSFMFYGNFTFLKASSFRVFDAVIWKKSIFNNFGLYFAYEVAKAMDNRIIIIPLLGLQLLSYRFKPKHNFYHKIIYPQGFEIVYKHPFGIENYSLVYGMFLGTSSKDHYINLWLRFGKKIFGEFNYIYWNDKVKKADSIGLSVGIPFFTL